MFSGIPSPCERSCPPRKPRSRVKKRRLEPFAKDALRTTNTTESKFSTGTKFATATAKRTETDLVPTCMLVLALCALENKLLPYFEGKYED